MRTRHSHTDERTTISIEGLPRTLTLLHITDSHVALADDRDPDALAYLAEDQARHAERTPSNVPADQLLQHALQHAHDIGADCTALTGDIGALSDLPGLQQLILSSTDVTGEIASLSGLFNLWSLNLPSTDVMGDVAALSGLVSYLACAGTRAKRDTDSERARVFMRGEVVW